MSRQLLSARDLYDKILTATKNAGIPANSADTSNPKSIEGCNSGLFRIAVPAGVVSTQTFQPKNDIEIIDFYANAIGTPIAGEFCKLQRVSSAGVVTDIANLTFAGTLWEVVRVSVSPSGYLGANRLILGFSASERLRITTNILGVGIVTGGCNAFVLFANA